MALVHTIATTCLYGVAYGAERMTPCHWPRYSLTSLLELKQPERNKQLQPRTETQCYCVIKVRSTRSRNNFQFSVGKLAHKMLNYRQATQNISNFVNPGSFRCQLPSLWASERGCCGSHSAGIVGKMVDDVPLGVFFCPALCTHSSPAATVAIARGRARRGRG